MKVIAALPNNSQDFLMVWFLLASVFVMFIAYYLWGKIKTRGIIADEIDAYIIATRVLNTRGHLINNLDGELKGLYSLESYPMLLRVKRNGKEYNLKQRDLFTMTTAEGLRCLAVAQLVNYDGSEECVTLEYVLSGNDLTDFNIVAFPMDETISEFILSYKVVRNAPQTYRTKLEYRCRRFIDHERCAD